MERFTAAPTKYDHAPFGTLCSVHINDEGTDKKIFIQTSHDAENAAWISVEELVIQAYRPQFEDVVFLNDCLSKVRLCREHLHENTIRSV